MRCDGDMVSYGENLRENFDSAIVIMVLLKLSLNKDRIQLVGPNVWVSGKKGVKINFHGFVLTIKLKKQKLMKINIP